MATTIREIKIQSGGPIGHLMENEAKAIATIASFSPLDIDAAECAVLRPEGALANFDGIRYVMSGGQIIGSYSVRTVEPRARLIDYNTTDVIRPATPDELAASRAAAERDGGRGVIEVDGRRCYVEE